MRWFEHLADLTERKIPLVMVTLLVTRGHAPREAGAKMLVTADAAHGTIGGGNLEATAVDLARRILLGLIPQGRPERADGFAGAAAPRPGQTGENGRRPGPTAPQIHTIRLTEKAPAEYGVQCCGGEVQILLEPVISAKPAVAVFGVGHVGLALAKVLSIFDIDLWLVDSRADMLAENRTGGIQETAAVRLIHSPIPETVVHDLPAGAHLLVMTHDHAEDIAVLDAALRRPDLGFIGLIGSEAKWANFKQKLLRQGFSPDDLSRVTCPIGVAGVRSKAPEAIAVATAAQLAAFLPLEPAPKEADAESA